MTSTIYKQLSPSQLVEHAIANQEGVITNTGALSVTTGKYTGRSPKDKFIVKDDVTKNTIHFGKVNQPIDEHRFSSLYEKVKKQMVDRPLYEFNGYVGSDKTNRLPIRIITEYAWHNLFAHQLFVRPTEEELLTHVPAFTVIDLPSVQANPLEDGTHSEAFVITSFKENVVIIGGTEYAGEIKKSLFGVMNYLLPKKGILPMHCGANQGEQGDVALFFGLSGTGKTTLSSSGDRLLIGDDEHAWTEENVFNLEGGCYAKTIDLDPLKEPDIYQAITTGAVLENVVVNEQGVPNYADGQLTENTRAAYPLYHIRKTVDTSIGKIPSTIFFLTADAVGVLPAISKLTIEQAMYYYNNGYTSKLAGTERGVTEPTATFSSCFGEPFLPLHPKEYVALFGEKLKNHNVDVYLINTGWGAGGYGKSERIPLQYTRKMVEAAINGTLKDVTYETEPIFDLQYPTVCPGVPSELLNPRNGWEPITYEEKATKLKTMFDEHYNK